MRWAPNQPTVGGYSNTNGVVAYQCNEQISFYFRADNLLNRHYHEYIGFPSPGISARVGISYRPFNR